MPLSLYRRLKLLDLTPTTISIQLADCSIRQPVGVLEDVPVRVGEFVIPCDFFVVDIDESPHMPIILGETVPYYSWRGNQRAAWHVVFLYIWRDGGFLFLSSHTYPSTYHLSTPSSTCTAVPAAPPSIFLSIGVFDGDRGPNLWLTRYDNPVLIPTSLRIPSAYTGKQWTLLHHSTPSPVQLPSRHRSPFRGKGQAKDLKEALIRR